MARAGGGEGKSWEKQSGHLLIWCVSGSRLKFWMADSIETHLAEEVRTEFDVEYWTEVGRVCRVNDDIIKTPFSYAGRGPMWTISELGRTWRHRTKITFIQTKKTQY